MWGRGSTDGDPFRVLGLDNETDNLAITDDMVKAKYHTLAKELHPDKNGGSEDSKRRFQELTQAYSKVATKDKRRELFESRGSFSEAASWGGVRRGHADSSGAAGEERYTFYRRNKFRDVSSDFASPSARASTKVDRWMVRFERFVHPRFLLLFLPLAGITYLSWTALKRTFIAPPYSSSDRQGGSGDDSTVPAWFNKKTRRFETPQPWNPDYCSSELVNVDRNTVSLVTQQRR